MNQRQDALKWAFDYLTFNKDRKVFRHQEVIETSYSIVYKIETIKEVFYLKITPESLFLEAKILKLLDEQGCQNIPKVIAEESRLSCFLTRSCGDESLRHLFQGTINLNQLMVGLANYTAIQRLLEKSIPLLLSTGISNWRLEKFPMLYDELIRQDDLLTEDGLTTTEIDQLRQLRPLCRRLCDDLAAYGIAETISHCDFHENNMLIDKETGVINVIDWGETAIAHPFFSLNGCLWNIVSFNALKETEPRYDLLRSSCVAPWLDVYEEAMLLKAFNSANQLLGIYAALGYQRMYVATQDQLRTVQQEHPGSIAGCLRTFLNHHI